MVTIYRQGRISQMTEATNNAMKEAEAIAEKAATDKAKKPAKPAKPATDKAATDKAKKPEAAKAKKPEMTEAEKKAAEAVKEAEKAATKAKREAEAERFRVVTEKALEGEAKEINVRFEKAEKLGAQADDHRLAAALKLADAKEKCREAKINFEDWCKANVKNSYETIRRLIPIGVAESAEEGKGKLLLADMRNQNAERNRKHRAEAKASALLVKAEDALKTAGDKATGAATLKKVLASLTEANDNPETTLEVLVDKTTAAQEAYTEFKKANGIGKRPELTPEQKAAHQGANVAAEAVKKPKHDQERVEEAIASCAKDIRPNVIKNVARANGFHCLTEEEHTKYARLKKSDEVPTKDKIEQLFSRLTGKEQAAVAAWAAAQVGGSFVPA